VTWPGVGLRLLDVPVFKSAGKPWCGLPAKPVVQHGQYVRVDGRLQFEPCIEWMSKARSEQFSQIVIGLLLKKHPDAFDRPSLQAGRDPAPDEQELELT
jgi:hypothetical protein